MCASPSGALSGADATRHFPKENSDETIRLRCSVCGPHRRCWPRLRSASSSTRDRRAGGDAHADRRRRRRRGRGRPGSGGAGQSQVTPVDLDKGRGRDARPHDLLRLRQLRRQGRVPRHDRRPRQGAVGRPQEAPADRRPHRRARRPRVQPGAGPEARRGGAEVAGAARRDRRPDRGGELRQGAAGRAGQRRSGEGEEPPRRADRTAEGLAVPRATPRPGGAAALALLALPVLAALAGSAQAALFEDDEARKAILDLRATDDRDQNSEQNSTRAWPSRASRSTSCGAACST